MFRSNACGLIFRNCCADGAGHDARRRCGTFYCAYETSANTNVYDLGSQQFGILWIPRLDIVVFDLAGAAENDTIHVVMLVTFDSDACNVTEYRHCFDIVFSNSVIKHIWNHQKDGAETRSGS